MPYYTFKEIWTPMKLLRIRFYRCVDTGSLFIKFGKGQRRFFACLLPQITACSRSIRGCDGGQPCPNSCIQSACDAKVDVARATVARMLQGHLHQCLRLCWGVPRQGYAATRHAATVRSHGGPSTCKPLTKPE